MESFVLFTIWVREDLASCRATQLALTLQWVCRGVCVFHKRASEARRGSAGSWRRTASAAQSNNVCNGILCLQLRGQVSRLQRGWGQLISALLPQCLLGEVITLNWGCDTKTYCSPQCKIDGGAGGIINTSPAGLGQDASGSHVSLSRHCMDKVWSIKKVGVSSWFAIILSYLTVDLSQIDWPAATTMTLVPPPPNQSFWLRSEKSTVSNDAACPTIGEVVLANTS